MEKRGKLEVLERRLAPLHPGSYPRPLPGGKATIRRERLADLSLHQPAPGQVRTDRYDAAGIQVAVAGIIMRLDMVEMHRIGDRRIVSIGVQKGPPIGVQKGPPSSSSVTGIVTGITGAPFALVAA